MKFREIANLALECLDDPNGRRFQDVSQKRIINAAMDDVKRVIEDCSDTYFVTQTSASPGASGPPYAHLSVIVDTDTLFLDLPADMSRLILVENIDENPPVTATPVGFQTRHPALDTRFLPTGLVTHLEYVIQGNQIGFVAPSGANTVRLTYIKTLPRWEIAAQDNDSPEIPADWHDLIAINAAKRGYAIEQREFSQDLEMLRQEQNQQLRWSMENRDISHQRFPNIIE